MSQFRCQFTFALMISILFGCLVKANAEGGTFTSNIERVGLTIAASDMYVEVNSSITATVTLHGKQPYLPDGETGTVTISATSDEKTVKIPPVVLTLSNDALTVQGKLLVPAQRGCYTYTATIQVRQGEQNTTLSSDPIAVFVYTRPKVLATVEATIDMRGGIVNIVKYPKAPVIVFPANAFKTPAKVTLEVLNDVPITPKNRLVAVWANPVRLYIKGASLQPGAEITVRSSAPSGKNKIALLGFLVNGIWAVQRIGEVDEKAACKFPDPFSPELANLAPEAGVIFCAFTLPVSQSK